MYLEVCLLNKTHPELTFTRICTKEVAITIHREVIINIHSLPSAIDEELHNVMASRIVDWIKILILGEYLI